MIYSRASVGFTLTLILLIVPPVTAGGKDSAPAPAFTLPTQNGTVSSDALKGKVVLVDFWASWCGPCQQSFPWLAATYERYRTQGLQILAINLDKKAESADTFLEKHPAPFTVAFDPSGDVARAFKVHGMPTSFLIGRDGNILYVHPGFDAKRTVDMETKIEEALKQ